MQASFEKLAAAADGTVGILFYDFRNDRPGDATLDTDAYLTLLTPTADGSLAFAGLRAAGNDFVAAFAVTNQNGTVLQFPIEDSFLLVDSVDHQDIVFTRVLRR